MHVCVCVLVLKCAKGLCSKWSEKWLYIYWCEQQTAPLEVRSGGVLFMVQGDSPVNGH